VAILLLADPGLVLDPGFQLSALATAGLIAWGSRLARWLDRIGRGRLPAWLAPVQCVVMGITDRQSAYVESLVEALKNQGFRAVSDLRNEKVGFKIRDHTLQRVPYLLVAGDKEVAANQVSVRTRNGKDLGTMSLQAFTERLRIELNSRGRTVLED